MVHGGAIVGLVGESERVEVLRPEAPDAVP